MMFLNKKGFTLVELTITMALLSILILIGVAMSSTTLGRNQTDNVTQDLVTTLRRAQWQSLNGHEDNIWGVHFETDSFTLFRGATYSFGDANNIVTDLPNNIDIINISLTGGGSDVIFEASFGGTNQDGSVEVDLTTSDESRTVTVNEAGMVDWN